jgi:adenine-specific DNA-methyltransferase
MQNLFEDLKQILAQDQRLIAPDGALLKNMIVEFGLKLDPDLLRLLISHDRIRRHFFAQVDDILVFDKDRFLQFVNNKEFLPDSYTAFQNKVGLSADGGHSYLSRRAEVALVWPYKDCVLEGGQTEEEAKRDEIFWNTTLAPDDIDRLLDPKVLTRFRRIDAGGEHEVAELQRTDNLIIKGNNLLALHCLTRRFGGKVKLIYIDPPYNQGNDDFGYNDRFNHSTWLTFMRSRLEVARDLLSKDGSIWINIDDTEAHYLKVLGDEIFGRENFVRNVVWQKRTSPDMRVALGDGHDHILVFAREIDSFKATANRIPKTEEQIAEYSNPDDDPRGDWVSSDFTAQGYRPNQMYKITTPGGAEYYPPEGRCWITIKPVFLQLVKDGKMWFGQDGNGVPRRKTYLSESPDQASWSWWPNDEVGHNQEAKKESIALFGASNPFSTPKPERLLQRIIHIGSNPGDIVLDFVAGSGTTAAVAHKMGRQFITIEQMDYVETFTVERLKKVVAGEQGGISQAVDWEGGGDFVVCELMQWNERYVERIRAATTARELQSLWQEMQAQAFLSYKVDVAAVNQQAEQFADLVPHEQKDFLLRVLDHNALYVNLSEIDDADYNVSEEDKQLTRQFYGE